MLNEVKSRPIIFSGEMVRAILEGRKSQTRRIIKVQPSQNDMQIITLLDSTSKEDRKNIGKHHWVKMDGLRISASDDVYFSCPYHNVDHLWVKEACVIVPSGSNYELAHNAIDEKGVRRCVQYFSDDDICLDLSEVCGLKKTPSIFMPKWASRITLKITNVRVERLNDISEEDAIAEGIISISMANGSKKINQSDLYSFNQQDDISLWSKSPMEAYKTLWESLHGKGSWQANPFVWVLEFRRV